MHVYQELEEKLKKAESCLLSGWNLAHKVQELEKDGFLKAAVCVPLLANANTFMHHYYK